MASGMGSTDDSSTATSRCEDIKDMQVHEIFVLAVPNDDNWAERTTPWYVFFYLMLVVYGLLYIALGVGCILLLWKRHLARRFRVNTFVAIDLALMTLAISRVLKFLLDPWGQSGYFTCRGCIIFSRLLSALAFPSLTASYTLVFITLWLSARMQLGRSCVQRLKILIPLCCVHYVVAIAFEIIGSLPFSRYPVVFLLVSCESFFTVWGFSLCFAFLFAGQRLLRSVKTSARNSSRVCKDSPTMRRQDLIEKSRFDNRSRGETRARSGTKQKLKTILREHHQRAIRKVTLITYMTATLGMLYSVVSVVNLTLVCLNLLGDCPGYTNSREKLRPEVWLTMSYITFTLELLLALLLTYSISDYQPVLQFLYKTCCGMRHVIVRFSPDLHAPESISVEAPSDIKNSKFFKEDSLSLHSGELESTIVVNGRTNGTITKLHDNKTESPLTTSISAT